MKVVLVEGKSFSLDEWLRHVGITGDELRATPYGLARAFSVGVWAYRCITLRAYAVSGIPIVIVDENGERVKNHPLSTLFGDSRSDLLFRIEASLQIWGETYLEIVNPILGMPVGLNWLNPLITYPVIGPKGLEGFIHTPSNKNVPPFAPEELIYLHYFNPCDDVRGQAPLAAALKAVQVNRNIITHAQAFFANGARLEGILSLPDAGPSDVEAAERRWKKAFRGVRRFFKTFIVGGGEKGATYTPITPAPKDLAMVELDAETRRDICAVFGVPPVLVGIWEAANYSTAEWRRSFYTETILPELDFIEDGLNQQFVRRFWPDMRLMFDISSVEALREDELTRNQAITTGYQGGWMTLNEARAKAGLPEVENGNTFYSPSSGSPFEIRAAWEVAASDPFRHYP